MKKIDWTSKLPTNFSELDILERMDIIEDIQHEYGYIDNYPFSIDPDLPLEIYEYLIEVGELVKVARNPEAPVEILIKAAGLADDSMEDFLLKSLRHPNCDENLLRALLQLYLNNTDFYPRTFEAFCQSKVLPEDVVEKLFDYATTKTSIYYMEDLASCPSLKSERIIRELAKIVLTAEFPYEIEHNNMKCYLLKNPHTPTDVKESLESFQDDTLIILDEIIDAPYADELFELMGV